jgi:hypothetical protein
MSHPMPKKVPEPGFYYHYKHDPSGPVNNYAYEVMGIGFHTEDNAREGEVHFLVYRPLYEAFVFKASKELGLPCFDNRPLEMWMEEVEKEGKKFPRFKKITDSNVIAKLEKVRAEMYS